MAEVFSGSAVGAEGFSRRIAIKRVLPGYSDNPGFAQMFVAEAQISSQLVHPNIVSVLDFDRDSDGNLFLVMELIEGKDLDALLDTGLLPPPVVIFVISEVLRGLGFAHDLPLGAGGGLRGVVHRDVSPHNVLLSWEGAVKVSDFGIAKARAASEVTASLFIKGKPAYMSPEQANGQRLDGRSDLFAVGVMLWEMLTGQRLFVAEDTRATLAAVLFGQIPRPRTMRGDVPKDLERVTMKLLDRDLPARYATAKDAIADLMNCADAPRDGREALISILAERFPEAAPVRQSLGHARHAGVLSGPLPAYARPTLTGSEPGALATTNPLRPGLGTLMSAETATLERPRSPGWSQVLIVLAVAVASGVVSFIIVSAIKHAPATGTHNHAGASSPPATGPTAPATGPTAASAAGTTSSTEPTAASAAPGAPLSPAGAASQTSPAAPDRPRGSIVEPGAIDTASAAAAKSGAPKPGAFTQQPTQPVDNQSGFLHVESTPVLTVTVDGKLYGHTPITITLPTGRHHVQLQNLQNDFNEVLRDVIIDENETTTIKRMTP